MAFQRYGIDDIRLDVFDYVNGEKVTIF
jgi:hypothetical protein